MANHENRSSRPDLPPLARALKAYRARHGLTLTTAADHFGVARSWVHEAESARGGGSTMARVLADCLDKL